MSSLNAIDRLIGKISRALRRGQPARRPSRLVPQLGLAALEERALMTVTPVPGVPFQPAGIAQVYDNHTTHARVDLDKTSISGDTINYSFVGTPGTVITLALYSSPSGNDDNMAAQKLEFRDSDIIIGADGTASYPLDIQKLLDEGKINLRGQRHFQVDFYVNQQNPTVAVEVGRGFTPSSPSLADSLVYGFLYDYTDTTGDRPKR